MAKNVFIEPEREESVVGGTIDFGNGIKHKIIAVESDPYHNTVKFWMALQTHPTIGGYQPDVSLSNSEPPQGGSDVPRT